MRKIEVDIVTHILSRCVKQGACLIWTGAKPKGYGVLMIPGTRKMGLAHKLLFEAINGLVPKGNVIMHSCDNNDCCNINHLSLGTYKRNVEDAVSKERMRNSKLNAADREQIKKLSSVLTDFDIAKLLDCSASAVQKARLGYTKPRDPIAITRKSVVTRRKNAKRKNK